MADLTNIPVPGRMRALARDKRGYPIPFTVMRDAEGRPHFTVNDEERRRRCLTEKRCPICGNRMDPVRWFVGGPMCAYHPRGAYADPPGHYECMVYALQVCPYLAAPRYLRRIDDATVDPEKMHAGMEIFRDEQQEGDRPPLVVLVGTRQSDLILPEYYTRALRPYEALEFWRHGARIGEDEATELMTRFYAQAE